MSGIDTDAYVMSEYFDNKPPASTINKETNILKEPRLSTGSEHLIKNRSVDSLCDTFLNSSPNSKVECGNSQLPYALANHDFKNRITCKRNEGPLPSGGRMSDDVFIVEGIKKDKMKDFGADEKGLFEELLLPNEECLLAVTSNLQKSESFLNLPQENSSSNFSFSLNSNPVIYASNDRNNHSEIGFTGYQCLEKNANSIELLSSHNIEHLNNFPVTNSDSSNLKISEIEEVISNISFENSIDKNISDLCCTPTNDVDNKLFNMLATDMSSDTLDQYLLDNFNGNVNSCNTEPLLKCGNVNYSSDVTNLLQGSGMVIKINQDNSLLEKYLKEIAGTQVNYANEKYNTKTRDNTETNIASNKKGTLNSSTPNIKIIKKFSSNSLSPKKLSSASRLFPPGMIQLKLISVPNNDKEDTSNSEKSSNQLESKSPTLSSQESKSSEEKVVFSTSDINNQINGKIAKINMVVNSKSDSSIISILSSNQKTTSFNVNSSDIVNAVSCIKEEKIKYLGLKKGQLLETANLGAKLLGVCSRLSNKSGNTDKNANLKSFEINHYVQELPVNQQSSLSTKPKVSSSFKTELSPRNSAKSKESCSTSNNTLKITAKSKDDSKFHCDNVGISLLPGAFPTMVSVPSVLDELSRPSSSTVNTVDVGVGCNVAVGKDYNEGKRKTKQNKSDGKTNSALLDLGINPDSLTAVYDEKGCKRWLCPIVSCSKQLPKLTSLKVHILNHKGIRPYKCSYENCDWSFYTNFKLKRHLETHLKRRDFVCTEPNCNRRFTTIYNLNTHMKIHRKPLVWSCSIEGCTKSFHNRKDLERHSKSHAGAAPSYRCPSADCKKVYFTPNSLASHMRKHNNEGELICNWADCGKKFEQPSRLKIHMRIHTGQRPYVCDFEGCNWKFPCASKLSRHQKKHKNDRKFSCPICKKAFLRSQHLKEHLLTHTGIRNFHCPLPDCEAKFVAKSSLYCHLKKHKLNKIEPKSKLPCLNADCEMTFETKAHLRRHMSISHPPNTSISESSQLDYITLLGQKDTLEQQDHQHLSTSLSFDVNKQTLSSFIPLSLHSCSSELFSSLEIVSLPEKNDPNTSPCLSTVPPDGNNILMIPDGLFTFSDCDGLASTSDLGFPDLPPKETFPKSSSSRASSSSSARTDSLSNIILSQRVKRRQNLKKTTESNKNVDLMLPSVSNEIPSLNLHLHNNLLPVDGITGALYDDVLMTRDLEGDSASDLQSTINLRDLE